MTLQVLLWALGTGFVTGAVWFAILFFRRNARQISELPSPPTSDSAESLSIDDMKRRLLELEERLDATEHVLMREKVEQLRKGTR